MNAPLTAGLAAVLASGLTAFLVHSFAPSAGGDARAADAEDGSAAAARPASPSPGDADAALALDAAHERIDELAMEVATLRGQLERVTTQRTAAMSEEELEGARQAAALLPDEASRTLILDVLAQKEEDERRQREEELQRRNEERLLERADRIAAELGLVRGDRDALHSVMVENDTRRRALFESMREDGFRGDRETIRTEMQAIDAWKEQELIARFGEDLAGQIDELDDDRRGGLRAFGGVRGGGGRGGGGGGRGGGN